MCVSEAWETLSRTGSCAVNSGRVYVGLKGDAYGDVVRFLAGEVQDRRKVAEELWSSLRKVTATETAFDREASHLLTLLPFLTHMTSAYPRGEIRAHDRAVASAAARLRQEIRLHPDATVRSEPSTLYWSTKFKEELARKLGRVPVLLEGHWWRSSPLKGVNPKGRRPAIDVVVESAPPLSMLLDELVRQMEGRAATRMTQAKRKQRGQWPRENRLVRELAPRFFARYPQAKDSDIARIIISLAFGCWNSKVTDDVILKQVQRERSRTISRSRK
jgi:hypothetical protein